ncbi:hypothetical protein RZE82_02950 [Mollicutes bacterium LVI A0039]|nr:hypothetical protein RZE82_02950 [Mollicutes bacterium LVI A0039]
MEIIEGVLANWKFYMNSDLKNETIQNSGKWMYFFRLEDVDFVEKICRESVECSVVSSAKHTSKESSSATGVACFYIDGQNEEQHKDVLNYFLTKNLIPRNKNGNYRNIAFKFDVETRRGNYKDTFEAKLNLSDFVNVKTGEFIN